MIETNLTNFTFIGLLTNMFVSWASVLFTRQIVLKNIHNILSIINVSILIFWFILRWKNSGHFPLSNLYESLIFLSTTLLIFQSTQKVYWVKVLLAPVVTFIFSFATLSLPKDMQVASALVPALQSNWLIMHVTVMIVSYATLLCGALFAIALLVMKGSTKQELLESPLTFQLDDLSYRTLSFGFPCLTIGILSGAVWANESWGSYWSWDPKETWALITWLVFAIYLHLRMNKGWKGEKSAWVATFGFFTIWICYLGVNLLGKGLHSYGWFTAT